MKSYCFACDLKDDDKLIKEYEGHHVKVWPHILQSITAAGITQMQLFRAGNRLFMIMEVEDDFSFEKKAAADAADPTVVKWENLMWTYQQAIPVAKPGEKWVLMNKMFDMVDQLENP